MSKISVSRKIIIPILAVLILGLGYVWVYYTFLKGHNDIKCPVSQDSKTTVGANYLKTYTILDTDWALIKLANVGSLKILRSWDYIVTATTIKNTQIRYDFGIAQKLEENNPDMKKYYGTYQDNGVTKYYGIYTGNKMDYPLELSGNISLAELPQKDGQSITKTDFYNLQNKVSLWSDPKNTNVTDCQNVIKIFPAERIDVNTYAAIRQKMEAACDKDEPKKYYEDYYFYLSKGEGAPHLLKINISYNDSIKDEAQTEIQTMLSSLNLSDSF